MGKLSRLTAVAVASAILGATMPAVLAGAVYLPSIADVPSPYVDPFYRAPSPPPDVAPGTILRSRPVQMTAFGVSLRVDAWQLMYRSTDTHGAAEAAVATVLVPSAKAATSPRPLLAYDVAWDSLTLRCSPSYQMRRGVEKEEPNMLMALRRGWTVVVSDFEGLEAHYGSGPQAGHGVLDGIRAAEAFGPAGLSGASTPVGIWGYSGGGQASAWASELAPAYAPELHIVGVAQGGVPVNLGDVARHIDGGPFAGIYFSAAIGVARAYPTIDIDRILNAKGKEMRTRISGQCIEQYVPNYAFQRIRTYTTVPDPLALPEVRAAIADDTLGQARPGSPVYMFHAIHDEIIPIADDDLLAAKYCTEGVRLLYSRDGTSDHNSLAITGASAAVNYLADRYAGKPAPTTC